ncbi:MAG: hypothetical protein Tsb0020_49540 [Haliangiales bacterium]
MMFGLHSALAALERPLHSSLGMTRRLPALSLLVLSLTVSACSDPPDAGDAQVEAVVLEEATETMASSFDIVGVTSLFEGDEILSQVQLELAKQLALEAARQALIASVRNRLCISVDTDQSSYVEVTYRDCPAGLLRLLEFSGSLRADLTAVTAPCPLGECPVALRYTLSTPMFRLGARFGVRFVELAGTWEWQDPLAAGVPKRWDSGYTVRTERGRALATSSRVAWTVGADSCVSLDFDGEFTIEGRDDVALVAASARGVVRCPGQCPSAGRVEIAFGRGQLLAWTYTGADQLLVVGPRGGEREVSLPCAQDEDPASE